MLLDRRQRQLEDVQQQLAAERQRSRNLEVKLHDIVAEKDEALRFLQEEHDSDMNDLQMEFDELEAKYMEQVKKRRTLHNKLVEFQGNIRVMCRVRPLTTPELNSGRDQNMVEFLAEDEMILNIPDKKQRHRFEFDQVFQPDATQAHVFDCVEPLIQSCLDGYSVCMFACERTRLPPPTTHASQLLTIYCSWVQTARLAVGRRIRWKGHPINAESITGRSNSSSLCGTQVQVARCACTSR